ncbi:MAG: 5-(carboxyamino)imidazole ribonucleotide mutase [Candidatus Methylarchaceae archaeon HK01B]|nr:5-(carboxyamino)imidazole ribonucleotide mutase [Candidatus Methylarchaceae archaeon HK01B]
MNYRKRVNEMEVAVIAGSKSDQKILEEICKVLEDFQIEYEKKILSAHRDRKQLEIYIMNSDADVFVAVAGLSAHLPGFIASLTIKPVIGVPISAKLGGLDALLSIVQMPSKVPVACVGIDNGKNAALLSIEILSIKRHELKEKLSKYRSDKT